MRELLSSSSAQDERAENVYLVFGDDDEKTTAEDCGDYMIIRHWENYESNGVEYWFERSGETIYKNTIERLYELI